MMRRWLVVGAVVLSVTAPLSAELKVTTKMSVREVPGGAAGGDMMAQMMAPMMKQMFGGDAGIEMTTTTHEDGRSRIEYKGEFGGLPAGTVLLLRADGSSVGYNPKAGTWWKMPGLADMPAEVADLMAQMKPTITTKKSGQFETLVGLRAERVAMTMVMPIPLPPEAANAPPELLAMIPREIRMDGDMWLSERHAKYAKATAKALTGGPMAQMGFDKLMDSLDGLMLKQVMRMSLLPGYEMETLVLSVSEEDTPDSIFDLPAGLKEVPMPQGGGLR